MLKLCPFLCASAVVLFASLPAVAGDAAIDAKIDAAAKAIGVNDELKHCNTPAAQLDYAEVKKASKKKQALAYALKAACQQRKAWLQTDVDKQRKGFLAALDDARKAIALDDKCAFCHFQVGANLGAWSKTKGIIAGATSMGEVKEHFQRANQLNPKLTGPRVSLATMDALVPGWLGGDPDNAKKVFRAILKEQPHFTYAKAYLAKLLLADGEDAQAKKLAQEVIDEKKPRMPASHKRTALKVAQEVLDD